MDAQEEPRPALEALQASPELLRERAFVAIEAEVRAIRQRSGKRPVRMRCSAEQHQAMLDWLGCRSLLFEATNDQAIRLDGVWFLPPGMADGAAIYSTGGGPG